MANYRIFVEKKPGFRVEAQSLKEELNENLRLRIESLRLSMSMTFSVSRRNFSRKAATASSERP